MSLLCKYVLTLENVIHLHTFHPHVERHQHLTETKFLKYVHFTEMSSLSVYFLKRHVPALWGLETGCVFLLGTTDSAVFWSERQQEVKVCCVIIDRDSDPPSERFTWNPEPEPESSHDKRRDILVQWCSSPHNTESIKPINTLWLIVFVVTPYISFTFHFFKQNVCWLHPLI